MDEVQLPAGGGDRRSLLVFGGLYAWSLQQRTPLPPYDVIAFNMLVIAILFAYRIVKDLIPDPSIPAEPMTASAAAVAAATAATTAATAAKAAAQAATGRGGSRRGRPPRRQPQGRKRSPQRQSGRPPARSMRPAPETSAFVSRLFTARSVVARTRSRKPWSGTIRSDPYVLRSRHRIDDAVVQGIRRHVGAVRPHDSVRLHVDRRPGEERDVPKGLEDLWPDRARQLRSESSSCTVPSAKLRRSLWPPRCSTDRTS